jgi:hypothetical protein
MKTLVVYGAGLVACSIVLLFPSTHAPASEVETRSYLEVIQRICVTGVTPEASKAHEQVVAALAKEGKATDTTGGTTAPVRRRQVIRTVESNPHGWTTTNLWGARAPEHANAECVQSP